MEKALREKEELQALVTHMRGNLKKLRHVYVQSIEESSLESEGSIAAGYMSISPQRRKSDKQFEAIRDDMRRSQEKLEHSDDIIAGLEDKIEKLNEEKATLVARVTDC